MMNPCLEPALQLNAVALEAFESPYPYTIDLWFFDADHSVYQIAVSAGSRESRLLLVYGADDPLVPRVDVEVYGSWVLLNNRPTATIVEDWVLFGWRHGPSGFSTVARAILWTGKALDALHAESLLATGSHGDRGTQTAPQGLLGIHNTRQKNWESICEHGLCPQFFRLGQGGIWLRPPSYGRIQRSRFKGCLSFLVDISGLRLLRYTGYELVVGQEIPLTRFQRVFDLDRKEDA